MANNLGMNSMTVLVLVGGLVLFGLGAVVKDSIKYASDQSPDSTRGQLATGALLMDLGAIVFGGMLIVAGFTAEGNSTAMRVAFVVVGALIAFNTVLRFSLGVAGSA